MPTETPPPTSQSPGAGGATGSLEKLIPKSPSSAPSTPHDMSRQSPPNPQIGREKLQQQQQQQQFPSSTLSSNQPPEATTTSGSGQTGSQQFCLRWNNYQTNLTCVFDQLLQNETFVDVTLACDGQSIKAHKMVLSACSPYFQTLFADNPCQHPIIIMRDVKWPELKAAVDFMYKGEINVSQDQIGPLLRVAEMLKIRGLADVNGDPDASAESPPPGIKIGNQSIAKTTITSPEVTAAKKARLSREWELSNVDAQNSGRTRKRRWPSSDNCSAGGVGSPLGGMGNASVGGGGGSTTPDTHLESASPVTATAPNSSQIPSHPQTPAQSPMPQFSIPPPLDAMGLSSLGMSHVDDMEIKPGIAEMIREEERAKLMENSHAWLGASTSSIADSYQYQLQSMWQKCWNTNQNLMHHLRFRERGPLKSWRPETMAEAIFSVLKEGLSLSQAARKYDIPYPTFVLYANRVHNMLGPSIDGGTDLRPKGRGRPQRILLGIWPDDHIKGVIKTVVFRDAKDLKDDGMHLSYGRHSPVFTFQDGQMNYPGAACANGLPQQPPVSGADTMSPEATAAAVAAVAHGIRQQMQMVAAAQHHPDASSNLFNLPPHHLHANNGSGGGGGGGGGGVSMPKQPNSPASNSQRHASPSIHPNPVGLGLSGIPNLHIIPGHGGGTNSASGQPVTSSSANYPSNTNNQQQMSVSSNQSGTAPCVSISVSRNNSPTEAAHDLRMNSPDESPLNSPLELALEPAVNLAVGVSGMTYKPSRGYTSPRPEHLFQEDIGDLVGSSSVSRSSNMNNFKEPAPGTIKIEPVADCRSE